MGDIGNWSESLQNVPLDEDGALNCEQIESR